MPAATELASTSHSEHDRSDDSSTAMEIDAKKIMTLNQHGSAEDQKAVEILTELHEEYGVSPIPSDRIFIEKVFAEEYMLWQNDCAPSIPSILPMLNVMDNDDADTPQPVAIPDVTIELSSYPELASAPDSGATVISAHISQMKTDTLVDLPYTNINMPNTEGQTALAVLVHRQDVAAVETCCLFRPDGNSESSFAALAEAALLPSDEIFCTLLRKICRSEGAEVRLIDRPMCGWRFLNTELCQYAGRSLEESLLLCGRFTQRLKAVRLAKTIGVDFARDSR